MGFAVKTMGAGFVRDVVDVLLFGGRQRHLAIKAHDRFRLSQLRVHADPPIKDETFPVVMGAATFFEVTRGAGTTNPNRCIKFAIACWV